MFHNFPPTQCHPVLMNLSHVLHTCMLSRSDLNMESDMPFSFYFQSVSYAKLTGCWLKHIKFKLNMVYVEGWITSENEWKKPAGHALFCKNPNISLNVEC